MTDIYEPEAQTVQDDEVYVFPASFAQQRLWFLEQLAPGLPVYNIPGAVRIRGVLDPAVLERSLNEIVRRHEVLRTTFTEMEGEPVQVIRPVLELTLPVEDLSGLPVAEREAEAQRRVAAEAARPFDITEGPLIRAKLLRLSSDEHVLVVTMHHVVSDGWSMGVFVRELAMLWEAYAHGRPSPLADLPIQYADFAVWQREHLQGEELDAQMGYWKERLAGAPALLELPTDRPRPTVQTFVGAKIVRTLPADLAERLKSLAREEDASLFMMLLAAFYVLLYRTTGQDDLVVGAPIANRNRPELEGLIGFFVNTLVLRTELSGNPTFREILRRVRETTLGAYAHEDLPFEKLVEELQPERNLSHTPLFQVAFTLQAQTAPVIDLPEISIRPFEMESSTTKFDLTLELNETADGLRATLDYNTDLFNEATARRFLARYERLLREFGADPDRRLAEITLLTEEERRFLLEELNATAADYPQVPVHRSFEAQVERTPDAVAVQYGDATLTYRELNARANRLAHALIARGVEPGFRVGFCVERSPEMLVSILGILKAGAAYVPLDADYPAARLRLMLEDSGTPLLVTQAALADRLPDHGAEMLRIDAQWDEIAQESADNPPLDLPAEASIYVMYTSGSTGRPKGIVIPHRAVSRLVFNARYMDFGPDERIAQAASVSFDAATFEIWGALLHGGTVVGIDKDVALVPRDFAAALRRERITSMFLTTALFNQIAREAPGAFNDLRNVLFGGEAADPLWVRAVLEAGPPKRLLNVYGPTESTTFATWYHVEAVPEEATTVPIGGPIGNTRVYVLDRDRVPVPVGVPGELYIGGDGLALGYLGRPELTAEHFVPDPFADDDAARLYRTGDLVRYRSDGAIEFIGRTDFQVKIRGFRIELGEIESVLTRHEAIEEAIVVVREDVPGDKRLVAYFVPAHLPAPPMRVLRQYLSEQLPAYMVPGAFVLMQELPLSPTGKIDRRALPRPERGATGDAFVAPRTPLEEELATIFGELLGLERVSVQDNFFTMGGHSLLATQLMSRVRERCGVEIPLRVLFETPTIEGLALAVNKAQSQADGPATARIDTVERGNQDLGDLLDDLLEE